MNGYTFKEHIHRFAVWTAARAVQRGFSYSTNEIKKAIEFSGLRNLLDGNRPITEREFEIAHKRWCHAIMRKLKCSYGRAAKIVAIYIKTTIILPERGNSTLARIAHPPIDNLILSSIAKKFKKYKQLSNIKWTRLNEEEYWELIRILIEILKEILRRKYWWELEKFWMPVCEIETLDKKAPFEYYGSVEHGTIINYGKKYHITVSREQYQAMRRHFKKGTLSTISGLENWIRKFITKTRIASYVAAILVEEEYVKNQGKRGKAYYIKFY